MALRSGEVPKRKTKSVNETTYGERSADMRCKALTGGNTPSAVHAGIATGFIRLLLYREIRVD